MDYLQLKNDFINAIRHKNAEYIEHYLTVCLQDCTDNQKHTFFQSVLDELDLDNNPELNDWLSRTVGKLKVANSSYEEMKKEFEDFIVDAAEKCGYVQERDFDVFENGIAFKNKEMIHDISRYFHPMFQASLFNNVKNI